MAEDKKTWKERGFDTLKLVGITASAAWLLYTTSDKKTEKTQPNVIPQIHAVSFDPAIEYYLENSADVQEFKHGLGKALAQGQKENPAAFERLLDKLAEIFEIWRELQADGMPVFTTNEYDSVTLPREKRAEYDKASSDPEYSERYKKMYRLFNEVEKILLKEIFEPVTGQDVPKMTPPQIPQEPGGAVKNVDFDAGIQVALAERNAAMGVGV